MDTQDANFSKFEHFVDSLHDVALDHADLANFERGLFIEPLELGDNAVVDRDSGQYQLFRVDSNDELVPICSVPIGANSFAILKRLVRYPVVIDAPVGWIPYKRQKPSIQFELDDKNLVYVLGEGFGHVVPL
jgi:hypothetical protein